MTDDGRWLVLGTVAAIAAAGLYRRGSAAAPHDPSDLETAMEMLDARIRIAEGLTGEERAERLRGAVYWFRLALAKLWDDRILRSTQEIERLEDEPVENLLTEPWLYHFTSYERLPLIVKHGLRAATKWGKTAVWLTTEGGIDQWAYYASGKGRSSALRQQDRERWEHKWMGAPTRQMVLRSRPIVIRVPVDRLQLSLLCVDDVGTMDARWRLSRVAVRSAGFAPESLWAFCYGQGIPPELLEWAHVGIEEVAHRGASLGSTWKIEGPWLPVRNARRRSPSKSVPLLVLVHPGSACGSADCNLGTELGRLGREGLGDELDDWRGGLLVVDGDLSDELSWPSFRAFGRAIRDALDRARRAGLPSERIEADASEPGWVEKVRRAVKALEPSDVQVSGAWRERDGCVVAVWEALQDLGIPVRMSEYALSSEEDEGG